jgi:hypothetical protein
MQCFYARFASQIGLENLWPSRLGEAGPGTLQEFLPYKFEVVVGSGRALGGKWSLLVPLIY